MINNNEAAPSLRAAVREGAFAALSIVAQGEDRSGDQLPQSL